MAANALSVEKMETTFSSPTTAPLLPPLAGSPQVTTDPSDFTAAKAPALE